ncbi:MAG: DUF167 domain-containing protein [Candidatus Manganitrophaceae bacterium]
MESPVRPYKKSGALLRLRVTPGASRTCLAGCAEGQLRIKLAALPEKGEANAACLRFLSELFNLPRSRFQIVRGEKSREKWVWIKEIDPAMLSREVEKRILEMGQN